MAVAPSLPTSTSKVPSITPQRFLFSQPQFIKKPELGGSFSSDKSQNLKTYSSRRRNKGTVRAVLGGLIGGLFKGTDTGEGTRKKYQETVKLINGMESEISNLSDSELRERTTVLKVHICVTHFLFVKEAFAVVREASKRVLGLRPFDVQLIGGMVLHKGEIAEMKTGEGKTLVAILPAYLNALTGKGVHIVTVNDYLARCDCEWVGQVPRFLGLQVGLIQRIEYDKRTEERELCM